MPLKTFGFGVKALKKYPELIPLTSIVSAACIGAGSYIFYALKTKPDVRLVRSKGPAWEEVKPTESRKLMDINKDKYRPNLEVERLKREIGSYKY